MNEKEIQTGDVVLVWDKDIIGKLIRLAVRLIFGIKYPCNHAEIALSGTVDISAEAKGVVYQDRKRRLEKAEKYVIARNARMDSIRQGTLIDYATSKYFGSPYDFYLHILWYFRFTLVFAPILWLISRIFYVWLKHKEEKAYMCSELVSSLLSDVGIFFGLDNHSFVTPSDIYQVIKACSDWEIIQEWPRREK